MIEKRTVADTTQKLCKRFCCMSFMWRQPHYNLLLHYITSQWPPSVFRMETYILDVHCAVCTCEWIKHGL